MSGERMVNYVGTPTTWSMRPNAIGKGWWMR
jgi:hypothetical protein